MNKVLEELEEIARKVLAKLRRNEEAIMMADEVIQLIGPHFIYLVLSKRP